MGGIEGGVEGVKMVVGRRCSAHSSLKPPTPKPKKH